jgi:hypothetical protein
MSDQTTSSAAVKVVTADAEVSLCVLGAQQHVGVDYYQTRWL